MKRTDQQYDFITSNRAPSMTLYRDDLRIQLSELYITEELFEHLVKTKAVDMLKPTILCFADQLRSAEDVDFKAGTFQFRDQRSGLVQTRLLDGLSYGARDSRNEAKSLVNIGSHEEPEFSFKSTATQYSENRLVSTTFSVQPFFDTQTTEVVFMTNLATYRGGSYIDSLFASLRLPADQPAESYWGKQVAALDASQTDATTLEELGDDELAFLFRSLRYPDESKVYETGIFYANNFLDYAEKLRQRISALAPEMSDDDWKVVHQDVTRLELAEKLKSIGALRPGALAGAVTEVSMSARIL